MLVAAIGLDDAGALIANSMQKSRDPSISILFIRSLFKAEDLTGRKLGEAIYHCPTHFGVK